MLVAVLSMVTMASCGAGLAPQAQAQGRVGATADGLYLDGEKWWPAGFNAYQLSTNWGVNRGCGGMVDLPEYFESLPPHSLTRFNAFQELAINKFTGELDFSAMDAVFAEAERTDQMIIPVLSAQDGACESERFKDRSWYVGGWKTDDENGTRLSFADWVRTAVDRWRDSAVVAAWELVGEPDPGECVNGNCDWWVRTCPTDAAHVLRDFMEEAGAEIKAIAPDHLVTAGLIGGGQCGTGGDDYQYVSESANVDFVQYHDYGADGVPLPGDQWNGLARRIDQAEAAGKPLVVAEIGENAGSCKTLAARASSIRQKITGQRAAGTAGALLWAFVPDPRPNDCTMDVGLDDPLFPLMAGFNTVG